MDVTIESSEISCELTETRLCDVTLPSSVDDSTSIADMTLPDGNYSVDEDNSVELFAQHPLRLLLPTCSTPKKSTGTMTQAVVLDSSLDANVATADITLSESDCSVPAVELEASLLTNDNETALSTSTPHASTSVSGEVSIIHSMVIIILLL